LAARSKAARDELVHIPKLVEHYKQATLARAFRCSGLHSSAAGLAIIANFRLTLRETIGVAGLTLDDPGLTLCETDLRSSAPAHDM
jgi:hypothetical protein